MDHTNLHEKVHQLKSQVNLDPARKAELKGALMLAVLRDQPSMRRNKGESGIFTKYFKPMPLFASFLLLTLLGGGASAAQASNPGDLLYPVKINVNEKVAAALSLGAEAKANTQVTFAEHRLDEATDLAAQGKLNAETKAKLETLFEAHADKVDAKIAELQANGNTLAAANLASRFETSLKAHQSILDRLAARSDAAIEATGKLSVKIDNELTDVAKVRGDLDDSVKIASTTPKVQAAANARVNAALKAITVSEAFIANKQTTFGAEATAKANARLQTAKDLAAQAQAKLAANAYGEAFVLAGNAAQAAQDARLQVRTSVRIKVEGNVRSGNSGSGSNASSGTADHASINGETNTTAHVQIDNHDLDSKLDSLLKLGL